MSRNQQVPALQTNEAKPDGAQAIAETGWGVFLTEAVPRKDAGAFGP